MMVCFWGILNKGPSCTSGSNMCRAWIYIYILIYTHVCSHGDVFGWGLGAYLFRNYHSSLTWLCLCGPPFGIAGKFGEDKPLTKPQTAYLLKHCLEGAGLGGHQPT